MLLLSIVPIVLSNQKPTFEQKTITSIVESHKPPEKPIQTIEPLPEPKPVQVAQPAQITARAVADASNLYSPGYCTYGVKQWRPEIPNTWGNANTWYSSAQAQGWPTGLAPRVGAAAAARSYNHVALVIGVSGNSVTIKEMNGAGGLWAVSTRVTPVSEWYYIY